MSFGCLAKIREAREQLARIILRVTLRVTVALKGDAAQRHRNSNNSAGNSPTAAPGRATVISVTRASPTASPKCIGNSMAYIFGDAGDALFLSFIEKEKREGREGRKGRGTGQNAGKVKKQEFAQNQRHQRHRNSNNSKSIFRTAHPGQRTGIFSPKTKFCLAILQASFGPQMTLAQSTAASRTAGRPNASRPAHQSGPAIGRHPH